MSSDRMTVPGRGFPPAVLEYLGRHGIEVCAAPRDTIVRRGEPGRAFWVVLEGAVEVRLAGEDGTHLPLARMEAGASFGEMALISGEPVSADVVALTPARLLRYPGERFAAALGESEPLRTHVMARLAASLRGTSAEAWRFFQQAKALNVLMGPPRGEGPIVAESAAMRPVRDLVARLGAERGPVLISGDPGTGKRYLAARLHEAGAAAEAPFIAVDCRSLAPAETMRFLFGAETADCAEGPGGEEGGLHRYGVLHLAHEGTLVLRHADRLSAQAQGELARYLGRSRACPGIYPAARLVCTSDRAPAAFREAVAPELAAALGERVIALPRLAERRKDVVALARIFQRERPPGREPRELSRAAEHALVSLRYSHRNAAELRESVEMAALISDEPVVRAEHIFSGPKERGAVDEIDLTKAPLVNRLLHPPLVGAARVAVFALFAAVVAGALLRAATPIGRAAAAVTWGLWEPALVASFLLLGRVWCTVCPLSTAGRLAARLACLGRSPGAWLKSRSGWLMIGGFLLIVWSERAFRMTERPLPTGLLLLALLAGALLFALLYRRETWCRYVCPLGNLGAILSLPAVLTVRANPSVCSTFCTTHECFKGSAADPGCPVFHHPLYACDAQSCKLCLRCLRSCPHGSARLYLRAPLQSVWAQTEVGAALVPFALFVFLFSPAMLASQGATWAASLGGFTVTALAALGGTIAASRALPRLLCGGAKPEPTLAARVAFALLVLAWGPAMSYQLGHVAVLASTRLHAEEGTVLARLLPDGGLSLLLLAQLGVIAFAALAAGICFAGIRARLQREGAEYSRPGWNLLLALGAVYLLGTLALVVPDGLRG